MWLCLISLNYKSVNSCSCNSKSKSISPSCRPWPIQFQFSQPWCSGICIYPVPKGSSEPLMELYMVECQLGSGCILPLMRLEMLTHSYSYSGWLKCNAMCATSTYCTCTHTYSLTGHAKETDLTLTTAHVETKVVMLVCQCLSENVQRKIKPQL